MCMTVFIFTQLAFPRSVQYHPTADTNGRPSLQLEPSRSLNDKTQELAHLPRNEKEKKENSSHSQFSVTNSTLMSVPLTAESDTSMNASSLFLTQSL